jgi:hypothetical protein
MIWLLGMKKIQTHKIKANDLYDRMYTINRLFDILQTLRYSLSLTKAMNESRRKCEQSSSQSEAQRI